jgi:hypothetical protein
MRQTTRITVDLGRDQADLAIRVTGLPLSDVLRLVQSIAAVTPAQDEVEVLVDPAGHGEGMRTALQAVAGRRVRVREVFATNSGGVLFGRVVADHPGQSCREAHGAVECRDPVIGGRPD